METTLRKVFARLGLALLSVAVLLSLATPAEAVRYKGAPKYVGVISYMPGTIKVSGKSLKQYHTRSHVKSATLTVRAKKRWRIAGFGGLPKDLTACQPANKTIKIGVTKSNSGPSHQFIVKPC